MMLYKIAFSEGNLGMAAAMAILIGIIGTALGVLFIRFVQTDRKLL
jgi:ABC-type sugar transport system permease subunit